MKLLKIFSLFVALHLVGWVCGHFYMLHNAREVLVVADTSFSMKQQFPRMESWINNYAANARYKKIIVGSDKAMLGPLTELQSSNQIFRSNFGRMKVESLQKYRDVDAVEKILLSDGSVAPAGWTVITFN